MILNFSHQKGGTGKSTLAYHITQAFIEKGYITKLIDLDNQKSCISVNQLRESPKDHILSVTNEAELINAIETAKEDEITIIDSGGFDSTLTRIAITGADINITPVADKVMDLLAVINKYSVILKEIEEATHEKTKTYVLLNKIHLFAENFQHIKDIMNKQERMEVLTTKIRDRGIYDKALLEGLSVHEAITLKGHEDASYELNKLAEELLSIYKEEN